MEVWIIQTSKSKSKDPMKIEHHYYYKQALISNIKNQIELPYGNIVGAILIHGRISINQYINECDLLTKQWLTGCNMLSGTAFLIKEFYHFKTYIPHSGKRNWFDLTKDVENKCLHQLQTKSSEWKSKYNQSLNIQIKCIVVHKFWAESRKFSFLNISGDFMRLFFRWGNFFFSCYRAVKPPARGFGGRHRRPPRQNWQSVTLGRR